MKNTIESKSFQLSLVKDAQSQIRDLLKAQMKNSVQDLIVNLFKNEVKELCGERFERKGDELFYRAGSDPGSTLVAGQRVSVKKPRVKNQDGDEVILKSYSALQDFDLLCENVMKHMVSGVSSRNYEGLLTEIAQSTGLKKSSVSKAFVQGSEDQLNLINSRSLKDHLFFAVMIDAIEFAGRHVLVALGFSDKGKKMILGLKEGSSENHEVCNDLMQSLIDRGFTTSDKILFILDGSKALSKSVTMTFGKNAIIQRCIRHKERNILKYLPKNNQAEFRRRWKLIHGSSNYIIAKQEFEKLFIWVQKINEEAANSMAECELDTLTVIKIGANGELRKVLHSTNAIESAFSNLRSKTNRVKNWKSGTNQVSRWSAVGLLAAEQRFLTIKGFKQIPILIQNLKNDLQIQVEVA